MTQPVLTAADGARAAAEALGGGPAVALVAVVDAPAAASDVVGRRMLLAAGGEHSGTFGDEALDQAALELARAALGRATATTDTVHIAGERFQLYAEAQRPPDELIVVGAGHIAVPLAELGVLVGFRTTVLDDREEFASSERFPNAANVLRTDFADPFRTIAIGPRSYLVLVTRAHKYDFDCLRDLVERDVLPRYIGMIGSRRRVRAAFHALLEAGIPRERLARVHAPVGLDIGAETPGEIAVSIAAELVRVRRADGPPGEGAARGLGEKERVLDRLLPEEEETDG